jgi:hypothetical protein
MKAQGNAKGKPCFLKRADTPIESVEPGVSERGRCASFRS